MLILISEENTDKKHEEKAAKQQVNFRVLCNIVLLSSMYARISRVCVYTYICALREMSSRFQEAHRDLSNLFTRPAKSHAPIGQRPRHKLSNSPSSLSGTGFLILDFFVFVRRI